MTPESRNFFEREVRDSIEPAKCGKRTQWFLLVTGRSPLPPMGLVLDDRKESLVLAGCCPIAGHLSRKQPSAGAAKALSRRTPFPVESPICCSRSCSGSCSGPDRFARRISALFRTEDQAFPASRRPFTRTARRVHQNRPEGSSLRRAPVPASGGQPPGFRSPRGRHTGRDIPGSPWAEAA